MPFSLPTDADFRKLCVGFWLDDVNDRIKLKRYDDAEHSWEEANAIYLSLGPGEGDPELESRIFQQRVKLDQLTHTTNENNF